MGAGLARQCPKIALTPQCGLRVLATLVTAIDIHPVGFVRWSFLNVKNATTSRVGLSGLLARPAIQDAFLVPVVSRIIEDSHEVKTRL